MAQTKRKLKQTSYDRINAQTRGSSEQTSDEGFNAQTRGREHTSYEGSNAQTRGSSAWRKRCKDNISLQMISFCRALALQHNPLLLDEKRRNQCSTKCSTRSKRCDKTNAQPRAKDMKKSMLNQEQKDVKNVKSHLQFACSRSSNNYACIVCTIPQERHQSICDLLHTIVVRPLHQICILDIDILLRYAGIIHLQSNMALSSVPLDM